MSGFAIQHESTSTRLKKKLPQLTLGVPVITVEDKLKTKYNVTNENISSVLIKIKNIQTILKYMSLDNILHIYKNLEDEIKKLNIEFELVDDIDRKIVIIKNPYHLANRQFYQSSGKSRGDSNIAGIWFPFTGKELGRFLKSEDKYLSAIDYLLESKEPNTERDEIVKEIIVSEDLLKYGRFINYENALLSGYLYYN